MSRKRHRDKPDNQSPAPNNPAPTPPPSAAGPARPWLVLTVVLGLSVLVAGAVLLTLMTSGGGAGPVVVMETSEGRVKIELFERQAPITVKNFLAYVDEKFYDGTIFHRVLPNFMIQGGGFEPGMLKEKATQSAIKNESSNGLLNERGTLAMARTDRPDSATAQFFVNLKHNDFLDRARAKDRVGYAVFGKVIEGMDVVDRIAKVNTAERGGHEGVPVQDVVIKSIRRAEPKKAS